MRSIQLFSIFNLVREIAGVPMSDEKAVLYVLEDHADDRRYALVLNSPLNAPIYRGTRRFRGKEEYVDAVVEQSFQWVMFCHVPVLPALELVSDRPEDKVEEIWDEEGVDEHLLDSDEDEEFWALEADEPLLN